MAVCVRRGMIGMMDRAYTGAMREIDTQGYFKLDGYFVRQQTAYQRTSSASTQNRSSYYYLSLYLSATPLCNG